jgi:hypothetical protein
LKLECGLAGFQSTKSDWTETRFQGLETLPSQNKIEVFEITDQTTLWYKEEWPINYSIRNKLTPSKSHSGFFWQISELLIKTGTSEWQQQSHQREEKRWSDFAMIIQNEDSSACCSRW